MCGITGYINTSLKPVRDTSVILKMLNIQRHRGPDDSGIRLFNLNSGDSLEMSADRSQNSPRIFEGVLGFNRLSILDLSFNGHQPMVSVDNMVLLTLNGEIYNAFGYKNELIEWGYKFKSTTDTEIVLALYLRYGMEGTLARLNGMFAIVIADLRSKELLIARDRFGIKPMYFVSLKDTFSFSSELKCFRYIDDFRFELSEHQLDEYLIFRNTLKDTLFKNVQTLTPGHYISYRHGQGIVIRKYFDINRYERSENGSFDFHSWGEKLENWLNRSVQSQLMSDVKLGCQLSGGIDSSLVTWLANRETNNGNFEAVSIVFGDSRFSEEKYINKVASQLKITSHKFLLDADYYLENFEKATWHLEMPINHPNTVAIYKLSQRAKEYVTVLLSGEGADEVFGGYTRFYDIAFPFHSKRLLREVWKNRKNLPGIVEYLDHETRAVMASSYLRPSLANKIKPGFNKDSASVARKELYRTLTGSLFDRQIKYEINSFLPDLLIRQDKMSMAHSIENRVPFLDNEVVENSFKIPEKYLLMRKSPEGYNTEKYLLKSMVAGTFGSDFAFRNKMGFGIPVREFFRNPGFSEYLNEKILPGIRKRGLFNYQLTSSWLSGVSKLRYYEIEALWIMVSFEIWASVFLENTYENSNSRD